MGARARAAWVFVLAAAAAVGAQTLLLVERQTGRLEQALMDDFRVVFFLRGEKSEAKIKVLEEKLRSQPETGDLRYVSPEEALAELKREDPELVEAVALVGDNPLPGAFEIRPTVEALPRLAAWIDGAQGLGDWSDVRWKQAQLQAILRTRLYRHWMRLALSTLSCAAAVLVLLALAATMKMGLKPGYAGVGFLGGAFGLAFAALAASPLRRDDLLWAAPPFWTQLGIVAACAALGWSLSLWRES